MAGQGSVRHQELVDLIRMDVVRLLQEKGIVSFCITAEYLMAVAVQTRRKGKAPSAIPDVILYAYDDDGPPLLVEVGEYNPGKWGAPLPVLHIAFSGAVSLINPTGREFEKMVALTTQRIITSRFSQ